MDYFISNPLSHPCNCGHTFPVPLSDKNDLMIARCPACRSFLLLHWEVQQTVQNTPCVRLRFRRFRKEDIYDVLSSHAGTSLAEALLAGYCSYLHTYC